MTAEPGSTLEEIENEYARHCAKADLGLLPNCIGKKWAIWSEGYRCTGQSGGATLHGHATGATFQDACDNFAVTNPSFAGSYDPKRGTYWGCRLFPSQHQAAQSFGY